MKKLALLGSTGSIGTQALDVVRCIQKEGEHAVKVEALDGGRLVFLIIEAIFRRPVPAKYERWVHAGGFALLICLMLAVTFQDIMRIATGG